MLGLLAWLEIPALRIVVVNKTGSRGSYDSVSNAWLVYLYLRRDRIIGGKSLDNFFCALLVVFVVRYGNCGLRWTDASARTTLHSGTSWVRWCNGGCSAAQQTPFDPAAAAAGISWFLRIGGRHGKNTTVQSGAYSFFFLADCAKHSLPSCFALNADSPYGLTSLPKAPGEKEYRGCVT